MNEQLLKFLTSLGLDKSILTLAKRVKSTPMAAILLALLMVLITFGIVLSIFKDSLTSTAISVLVILFMAFAFVFLMVFLIHVLPLPGEPEEKVNGVINGILKLNGNPVPGATVSLLTTNGDSVKTNQNGLFTLLPDPHYREWKIRATYQSPSWNFYAAERLYKPKDLNEKSPPDIVLHSEEETENEIILQKLKQLKAHIDRHREHIELVVNPLIKQDKLVDTIEQFKDLVEHHHPWSEPYSDLLYGELKLEKIHLDNGNLQTSLTQALKGVKQFTDAAFMQYQSFVRLTQFDDAVTLYNHYTHGTRNDKLREKLKAEMKESFKYLVSDEKSQRAFADMSLETLQDVTDFVKEWCKAWYRKVQDADKDGLLSSAITSFEGAVNRSPEAHAV